MSGANSSFHSLVQQVKDNHQPLAAVTQEQQCWLQGSFLRVVRDTVMQPNGRLATREYVKHPGAVVVVPMLDDGSYLLERQYRHPMGRMMIEFPAGKLDDGEPGLLCAQRELLEETGCVAREWAYAGVMHNCIGYSDEHIEIWFARGLTQHEQALEEGELLHLSAATLPELLQLSREGLLTDAKTLTCLLWLQLVHNGSWTLDWQGVGE